MGGKVTVEQLLNLADRAEFNGGLSQAEADRLRRGLRDLVADRDAAEVRRRMAARRDSSADFRRRRAFKQLATVRALLVASRQRGNRAVPVWILDAALSGTPEIRQGSRAV
jgi:hypothetical protein